MKTFMLFAIAFVLFLVGMEVRNIRVSFDCANNHVEKACNEMQEQYQDKSK